jgi:hypothetical protein
VLAALGALGAASLCGIDIESEAVASSALLLRGLGHGANARMYHGDMWLPVTGRRFDLITANLPHFPIESGEFAGRLPSWSSGGPDGRRLLDRFLDGLAAHLAPGSRAIITHNAFVDLELSRAMVARLGVNNGHVLRDAAIAGLGLVALPTFIVSEALQCGELEPVLRDFDLDDPSIYAVWSPNRELSAKVIPSSRAAMLTPSPRMSSPSTNTSPRWTPIRHSIRRSWGLPALRSAASFCSPTAHWTAPTTEPNSISTRRRWS